MHTADGDATCTPQTETRHAHRRRRRTPNGLSKLNSDWNRCTKHRSNCEPVCRSVTWIYRSIIKLSDKGTIVPKLLV
ncbi:hypothetical protein CYMTET_21913 [Cymbomonas tetramitiformis]|uniref:Uncharacterized protein n=1 Tax=Cymbomonas tetramitiformis TaxID=36881 RepID=A0AAE0G1W3_9CHLO|nr:hypothetical protein CYMTET_21913 [Cymbomonas tetramitiformis]